MLVPMTAGSELDELRRAMEEGFDRLDRRVDSLHARIDQRFDKVDEDHRGTGKWVRFIGVMATVLTALGVFFGPIVAVLAT
jgi:hypothetical protein